MNKQEIKELFVRAVVLRNGCKASELATVEIIDLVLVGTGYAFTDIVEELVNEGKLNRIEYTTPYDSTKTFLVPAGTHVKIDAGKRFCFSCKHSHYDVDQKCIMLRNICDIGEIDPYSGTKARVSLSYFKNQSYDCQDYEKKNNGRE